VLSGGSMNHPIHLASSVATSARLKAWMVK